MRRMAALLLAAALLIPAGAGADMWLTPEEFDEEYGPYCRMAGSTLILNEGVTALGTYYGDSYWDAEAGEWVSVYDPEMERYFEDAVVPPRLSAEVFSFSRVQWPASLRCLGSESFHALDFDAFTLPSTVEQVCRDAFVYCDFPVFRIEADLPWEQLWNALYDCDVKAWDAPADHPLYKAVDGVLFSRDGKTLLSYPNARRDTHYDVPRGVERIADRAFHNPYLQTLSLPIGLTAVGDYAFANCTRLHAIALPLTVEEIGGSIFYDCVSLELVSLPEGLRADKNVDEYWSKYYENDSVYRGDNGGTETAPVPENEYDYDWEDAALVWEPGRVLGGGEAVAAYAGDQGDRAARSLTDGTIVWMDKERNGRCQVLSLEDEEPLGWVDMRHLSPIACQTLFSYAGARPPRGSAETGAAERSLVTDQFMLDWWGPFVKIFWEEEEFEDEEMGFYVISSGMFPLTDAELYRTADGPEGEYGYVYGDDPYAPIALRSAPEGEETIFLYPGDQVKALERSGDWALVTNGFDSGWVRSDRVFIVPMLTEDLQ